MRFLLIFLFWDIILFHNLRFLFIFFFPWALLWTLRRTFRRTFRRTPRRLFSSNFRRLFLFVFHLFLRFRRLLRLFWNFSLRFDLIWYFFLWNWSRTFIFNRSLFFGFRRIVDRRFTNLLFSKWSFGLRFFSRSRLFLSFGWF